MSSTSLALRAQFLNAVHHGDTFAIAYFKSYSNTDAPIAWASALLAIAGK